MTKKDLIKAAGFKSEKEFYKKYPTQDAFINDKHLRVEVKDMLKTYQGGGEEPGEENEYQALKEAFSQAGTAYRTGEGDNPLASFSNKYSINDYTSDYHDLKDMRNQKYPPRSWDNVKEEAETIFPYVGNQIGRTVNDLFGTNFQDGGGYSQAGEMIGDYNYPMETNQRAVVSSYRGGGPVKEANMLNVDNTSDWITPEQRDRMYFPPNFRHDAMNKFDRNADKLNEQMRSYSGDPHRDRMYEYLYENPPTQPTREDRINKMYEPTIFAKGGPATRQRAVVSNFRYGGAPTAEEFFNYGRPTPNMPRLMKEGGALPEYQTNGEVQEEYDPIVPQWLQALFGATAGGAGAYLAAQGIDKIPFKAWMTNLKNIKTKPGMKGKYTIPAAIGTVAGGFVPGMLNKPEFTGDPGAQEVPPSNAAKALGLQDSTQFTPDPVENGDTLYFNDRPVNSWPQNKRDGGSAKAHEYGTDDVVGNRMNSFQDYLRNNVKINEITQELEGMGYSLKFGGSKKKVATVIPKAEYGKEWRDPNDLESYKYKTLGTDPRVVGHDYGSPEYMVSGPPETIYSGNDPLITDDPYIDMWDPNHGLGPALGVTGAMGWVNNQLEEGQRMKRERQLDDRFATSIYNNVASPTTGYHETNTFDFKPDETGGLTQFTGQYGRMPMGKSGGAKRSKRK